MDFTKKYEELAKQLGYEKEIAAQAAADLLQLPLETLNVGESGLLDEIKRFLDHI